SHAPSRRPTANPDRKVPLRRERAEREASPASVSPCIVRRHRVRGARFVDARATRRENRGPPPRGAAGTTTALRSVIMKITSSKLFLGATLAAFALTACTGGVDSPDAAQSNESPDGTTSAPSAPPPPSSADAAPAPSGPAPGQ